MIYKEDVDFLTIFDKTIDLMLINPNNIEKI